MPKHALDLKKVLIEKESELQISLAVYSEFLRQAKIKTFQEFGDLF